LFSLVWALSLLLCARLDGKLMSNNDTVIFKQLYVSILGMAAALLHACVILEVGLLLTAKMFD